MFQPARKGLLTPIRFIEKRGRRNLWLWRCDCGTEKILRSDPSGAQSCGCLRKGHGVVHGMWNTRVYRIWAAMLQRVLNPNSASYFKYGGRGITVCDRWLKFEHFFADMGEPPTNDHSIERKNNEEGYCKRNCKWATSYEQNRNKRNNVLLTVGGRTQILADWATELKMAQNTLAGRLNAGWTPEQIVGIAPPPKMLTLNGENHTLMEWSRLRGVKHQTISWRLRHGRTLEEALTP